MERFQLLEPYTQITPSDLLQTVITLLIGMLYPLKVLNYLIFAGSNLKYDPKDEKLV